MASRQAVLGMERASFFYGSARVFGGVEHFGQTGSIPDLYRHYGIDANAIVAAAAALTPGRPIRYLKALP